MPRVRASEIVAAVIGHRPLQSTEAVSIASWFEDLRVGDVLLGRTWLATHHEEMLERHVVLRLGLPRQRVRTVIRDEPLRHLRAVQVGCPLRGALRIAELRALDSRTGGALCQVAVRQGDGEIVASMRALALWRRRPRTPGGPLLRSGDVPTPP